MDHLTHKEYVGVLDCTLNKKLEELTREEYVLLLKSGMLWEIYPSATGVYAKDCIEEPSITLLDVKICKWANIKQLKPYSIDDQLAITLLDILKQRGCKFVELSSFGTLKWMCIITVNTDEFYCAIGKTIAQAITKTIYNMIKQEDTKNE